MTSSPPTSSSASAGCDVNVDWNAIGAISGWVAASVAASAFLLQRRQMGFSANLDSLWRLEDEFNSEAMCDKRARVAKRLIARDRAPDRDTEDILDIFDLISATGLVPVPTSPRTTPSRSTGATLQLSYPTSSPRSRCERRSSPKTRWCATQRIGPMCSWNLNALGGWPRSAGDP